MAISGLVVMPSRIAVASSRHFGGRKAKPRGDCGIDLEVRGGAADGVLDAVLDVDHAGDLCDGVAPRAGQAGSAAVASSEKSLIWIGSGALDRSLMLSCSTCVSSMSSSGSVALMRLAHFIHHIPDRAAAFCLSFTVKSPVLASVTAASPAASPVRREVFSTSGMECRNAVDVLENAVGLGQRAARGHDVVENEAALVHLRQQIGAEQLVAGPRANHQQAGRCRRPRAAWPAPTPERAGARASTRPISDLRHARLRLGVFRSGAGDSRRTPS